MAKNHLKTIAAPQTWPIERKNKVFTLKPMPGTHSLKNCLTLSFLLTDILTIANTKKEVKFLLNNKEVLVDGKKRKERDFPVGLFDVISIKDIKKNFRITLDKKGKLHFIEVDDKDASIKVCKITGKTLVAGKTQLNLYDGRNILINKPDHLVGDSLVIDLTENKVKGSLKLEKGNTIFLIGGKNPGNIGQVEDVIGNKIIYKKDDKVFETLKKFAFVVGKEKPVIKLE